MSSKPFIPGFSLLGQATYLYEPTDNTGTQDPRGSTPDLIYLPVWLDAQPRHIAKYVEAYRKLFPSSKILVTTSSMWDVLRNQQYNIERVSTAVGVLAGLPAKSKILIHLFSNGGAIAAAASAARYQKLMGVPIPVSAMVFDSTPGNPTYSMTVHALAAGLPKNPIIRLLGQFFIHAALSLHVVLLEIFRQNDIVRLARGVLNDKTMFSSTAPRIYIFSKQDAMVWWEDVLSHAAEATQLGWKVETEEIEGSNHVGHMMVDPARYWAIIQRVWRLQENM